MHFGPNFISEIQFRRGIKKLGFAPEDGWRSLAYSKTSPAKDLLFSFRMLFEQQLQVEREKYGHVWPAAPLKYAELKTLLYDQRDGEQDDDAFFALLEKEVLRINRCMALRSTSRHR